MLDYGNHFTAIFNSNTFSIHTTSILGDHLQSALKNSGENRSELENALTKFRGEDTNDLIAHASQYDLVNRNGRANRRERHLCEEGA